jgi:hypothetical protein
MSAIASTFFGEIDRIKRSMKIYNLRFRLAPYPKDWLAHCWRVEGDLPYATSMLAFFAKRGRRDALAPEAIPRLVEIGLGALAGNGSTASGAVRRTDRAGYRSSDPRGRTRRVTSSLA